MQNDLYLGNAMVLSIALLKPFWHICLCGKAKLAAGLGFGTGLCRIQHVLNESSIPIA